MSVAKSASGVARSTARVLRRCAGLRCNLVTARDRGAASGKRPRVRALPASRRRELLRCLVQPQALNRPHGGVLHSRRLSDSHEFGAHRRQADQRGNAAPCPCATGALHSGRPSRPAPGSHADKCRRRRPAGPAARSRENRTGSPVSMRRCGSSIWNHMPGCCGAPLVHPAKLTPLAASDALWLAVTFHVASADKRSRQRRFQLFGRPRASGERRSRREPCATSAGVTSQLPAETAADVRGDGGDPLIVVRAHRHHDLRVGPSVERTGQAVQQRLDDVVAMALHARRSRRAAAPSSASGCPRSASHGRRGRGT